jgi:putative selenate reductase
MGAAFPISFSAGLDQHNVCNAVAMNFVPVTTCTDLLRPGGYARLPKYLENLGAKMRELSVTRIADFVVRYEGTGEKAIEQVVGEIGKRWNNGGDTLNLTLRFISTKLKAWLAVPDRALSEICADITSEFARKFAPALPARVADALRDELGGLEQALVEAAGVLNTPSIVDRTTADPRYRWEKNKAVPRKIGSKLWLYDCISCDKCVPVCPNDANFVYENEAAEISYDNYELLPGGKALAIPGGAFKVARAHQLANYADACNDCGNCDVFCPEDGGPQIEKPRFFGSLESYQKFAGRNGFFLDFNDAATTIHGTIAGKSYTLTCDANYSQFDNGSAELQIRTSDDALVMWSLKPGVAEPHTVDMLPYLQLKYLLEAVSNPSRAHYANVAGLTGAKLAQKGAIQG